MNSKEIQFKVNNTQESDLPILKNWWKEWGWPIPPREMLPDNISSGLIVSYKGKPVVAAFIYATSASKTYLLEYTISDPNFKEKDLRKKAIHVLLESATEYIKQSGGLIIFSFTNHKNLANHFVDCGFAKGDLSYEMIKAIR